ncbi:MULTISPECIES: GlxA family transcriptional regulator [Halopseudomonas]|uniref:Transcriptional regulator GlxA family, contains an amidase domain and an AraC-type DNA-binding HTH domain n=1 Tax=Halopseudomonas bauzanensis TaxID=653930 RepID=A0A1I4MK77_9GAMM|nr:MULTISPECIES: helix-turn-helix domain-containing protein [Halopseudomonas]WGK61421.1 helix-turn-helix domain-containing protein [Halopseudomonas sp. SMJS2]SES02545.1 transcriptional regulator, AraC family with amidase-like domain [Halopseudomonas bauzanensis]SFM03427.1 Transcriptional regulator GlxA family, contains an amidase domain and an AraC-type DNA-binding HTH domain [Halopseudomonas bauzanensis]
MSDISVVVLAFDGVSLFHLSVPGMVFGADEGIAPARYEVLYCTQNPGRIRSDQGVMIDVPHGLDAMAKADIIIVPAWSDPGELTSPELTAALQQAHEQGKLIVGLCLGAFALGHAGLLDGREATTHWAAREMFAKRFPRTLFRPDVLYVADSNIVTSAGTVAAIDCCLHLLRERHGSEAANHVARLLVTPPHRAGGQAQYIERPVPRCANDDRLPGVLEWARANLAQPLSLDALAEVAKMSRRTFTRRFREATGTTVTKWLNAERVARAQQLLETTDLSIERITSAVGFGTPLALRQQFAAQLGTSPSSYRRTFNNQVNATASSMT